MLVELKKRIVDVASPHYFTGRSLTRLALQQTFRFLLFLRADRPSKSTLSAIHLLANQGKGKSALVLGNGPSLDRLVPAEVSRHFDDVFVVNGYFNLEISQKISPSYYCTSDPLMEAEVDAIESHQGQRLRNYLAQNGNCVRLLPHTWNLNITTLANSIVYFDDRERTLFSRNISPLKPRAYTSVTSYKALAIACFMGYDKIYILGFDNTEFSNYVGTLDNKIQNKESTYAELNHGGSYSGGNFKLPFVSGMSGRMQSYAHLFGDLKLFARHPIFNLDPNSLTDTFPKIESHPALKILE